MNFVEQNFSQFHKFITRVCVYGTQLKETFSCVRSTTKKPSCHLQLLIFYFRCGNLKLSTGFIDATAYISNIHVVRCIMMPSYSHSLLFYGVFHYEWNLTKIWDKSSHIHMKYKSMHIETTGN